jgi:chromosome partitioning protein
VTRILAIANQKGGVGKTTTSVNLAASLAATKRRVLLVDLDPQGNATMGLGIDKHELEHSVYEVLIDDAFDIQNAIQKSETSGCDILPANSDLAAAKVEMLSLMMKEQRLKHQLKKIRDNYDYILIDCPPALNILAVNALTAADGVLIAMQCEYYALEGLSDLLSSIEQIKNAVNPQLEIEGILRTMYDPRMSLTTEVSSQLAEHFGDKLYRSVIPRNIKLAEAPSYGLPVMHYDRQSKGALAYLALAGEMLRRHSDTIETSAAVDIAANH